MTSRGFIPLAVSLVPENCEGAGSGLEGGGRLFAHHLFYKQQRAPRKAPVSWDGEEEEDKSQRTLFVANIPPTFDYSDVMSVFSCFGAVDSVVFQTPTNATQLPPGALTSRRKSNQEGCVRADVIFADEESMRLALNAASLKGRRQPFQQGAKATGTNKWLSTFHSNRPKSETLQLQVDRFMEAFDQREKQAKAAASGPLVDDEGWTLVRSSGKRRRLLLPKGVEEQGRKKKKKKGPVLNFYKHQQIQKKRDALADLRRKFEQDKERLAKKTATRKFNPF